MPTALRHGASPAQIVLWFWDIRLVTGSRRRTTKRMTDGNAAELHGQKARRVEWSRVGRPSTNAGRTPYFLISAFANASSVAASASGTRSTIGVSGLISYS